jgi:two-component system, NarL family, response regulator NreC
MNHRILLVDDHQMFREGLKAVLKSETDFQVVGEAENGIQAVELCRELTPDVVIMDISMPEMSGVEAAGKIHAESPAVKIIILSMHTEKRYILGALKAGATGIVAKNSASAELLTAIETVVSGQTYLSPSVSNVLVQNILESGSDNGEKMLSPRERQILQLIAMGKGTKEIGEELGISNKTVEAHRMQLMNKLDIRNVADLVKYAIREGLIEL